MFARHGSLVRGQFVRSYIAPVLDHLSQGAALPGLFSSKGLDNAWFARAEAYTKKLNSFTNFSEEIPLETLIYENAQSSVKRHIVNYASLLFNLRFALSSLRDCQKDLPNINEITSKELLKTPELTLKYANEPLETRNKNLHNAIVSSFGSIVEFRSLLLNSNLSISGDGFTWLVARRHAIGDSDMQSSSKVEFDKLFILNTYNAGTPFNFNKSGHMDSLRLQYLKRMESIEEEPVENSESSVQNKSIEEAKQTEAYKKTSYIPLLAIDASPKAWLHDYGIFGKQKYLDRVWESIEWDVVESRLPEKTVSYGLY